MYAPTMLWRSRSTQARPKLGPLGFILPWRPTVSKRPSSGDGWVHEVKHDGYRLQVHVRAGRVRLYTMNAADWTERYPFIVQAAARLKRDAVFDCEVRLLPLMPCLFFRAPGFRDAEWANIRGTSERATEHSRLAFRLILLGACSRMKMRRKAGVTRRSQHGCDLLRRGPSGRLS